MSVRRAVLAAALAALACTRAPEAHAGSSRPKLGNDDLCGTSLLEGEGSHGRSDEQWNRRLERYFRDGSGLALRHERIGREGPPDDTDVAWLAPRNVSANASPIPSGKLSATRYEVGDVSVLEVTVRETPYVSATAFVWLEREGADEKLGGAAVLVSNDSGEQDDNGYFVRHWSNRSTGTVTFEEGRWPFGGDRLAIDLVYESKRIGVAGDLRALVAIDRVPEGDPMRIGRLLRDAGIVRAPCLHPDLDPDVLEEARREMARDEALAVVRAAAEFVALDAQHAAPPGTAPAARAEVRCPGGRVIAEASLYTDAAGVPRRLTTTTIRVPSIDDTVYSYDTEGRLRFVRMTSKRRDSNATGHLEVWYDETGSEAGSKHDNDIVRPRPGTSPSAEIAWVMNHEAELRKACQPGW